MLDLSITNIIIIITCLISFVAFNSPEAKEKLLHHPYRSHRYDEKFRLLSSGFVHGDLMHLLFNMLTLYFFGSNVERWFSSPQMFGSIGLFMFILFYLVAIVAAGMPTYFKHKDNVGYRALGASGAIAAVLFAHIIHAPLEKVYIQMIFPIPGFLFGVLYLWYSSWAAKNANDNVGHETHYYGAIFGVLFVIVLKPALIPAFFQQVASWF